MRHRFTPFVILAIALAALNLTGKAQAQLEVSVSLDKKTHVAYEDVVATISVFNRAGRDIILAGPSGASWMEFFIKNDKDQLMGSIRPMTVGNRILKAGDTFTQTVVISDHYRLNKYGHYRVSGGAYFPTQKRFYRSREASLVITEARTFWTKSIGVPANYSGAGAVRKYELMTFQDYNSSQVYLRIRDQETSIVLTTYPLGRLIPFRDPQVSLDPGNRLHVLFMTGPNIYRHVIVQPDGVVATSVEYKAGRTDPTLTVAKDGTVRVRGGLLLEDGSRPLDATDVPVASGHSFIDPLGGKTGSPGTGGSSSPGSSTAGRSLSDRPPGL